MEYIAYLHKDPDSDYGVSFPDFPGCVTAGATLQEAREMAEEALSLHVAGMQHDGEDLPEPSTLDDLNGDPAMRGAVAILVEASEPEKTVRINITLRESELREIDARAKNSRLTRSAYMVRQSLATDRTKSKTIYSERGITGYIVGKTATTPPRKLASRSHKS